MLLAAQGLILAQDQARSLRRRARQPCHLDDTPLRETLR